MNSTQSRIGTGKQSGINLFEMLALMALLCAIFIGFIHGAKWGITHGRWMSVVGAICGAGLGAVGFLAALFLIFSPFALYEAIKRCRQPGDLVCVCRGPGHSTPEHLIPKTPLEVPSYIERIRREWLPWITQAGATLNR